MDEIMAAEEVSTWSGSRGVGEMVVEIMHMWVCYGVGGELDLLGVVVLVVGCRSRLRLRLMLRGPSQLLTDNEIFPVRLSIFTTSKTSRSHSYTILRLFNAEDLSLVFTKRNL